MIGRRHDAAKSKAGRSQERIRNWNQVQIGEEDLIAVVNRQASKGLLTSASKLPHENETP